MGERPIDWPCPAPAKFNRLLAEVRLGRQVAVDGQPAGTGRAGAGAAPAYEGLARGRRGDKGHDGARVVFGGAGAAAVDSGKIAGHGAGVATADLQGELGRT